MPENMVPLKRATDAVHWFMSELGARVVAESGISSDRHHLGKLILRSLKDAPEFVMQIDATTGESETYKSVLERSVRCAFSFRKFGLKEGDNIVLMGPNHLDLTIPYLAALYVGVGIAALDAFLEVMELEAMFKINEPKIVFCQNERAPFIKKALKNANLNATVVTFDKSENCIDFPNFVNEYGGDAVIEQFRATDLDPAETIAVLVSTSGSTGFPKSASLTHKNVALSAPLAWLAYSNFPTPTRLVVVSSPLQWLSAGWNFLFSPILRYTRLQSSATFTADVFVEIINKYKPSSMMTNPTLLTTLTTPENTARCDISCFEVILLGGSAISEELLADVRKIAPNIRIYGMYGMSETGLSLFDENPPPGALGRPLGAFDYRLVNTETNEDITESHVNGELWLRGPHICKGYYNKPEATKEAYAEDGWWKTGDIFYRDENYYFYFVDRLKLLLKYKNHQISPVELETVIKHHPGVLDVAVTSIPDRECGDLPVACVVTRSGHTIAAREIKDLVKMSLTDTKQLRGGVIFMNELPVTSTTKVHRQLLKKMVQTMDRELSE